jgi:hypothetical protein
VENEPQIRLGREGGKAGGGAGSLRDQEHEGKFRHTRKGEPLGHEAETPAGRAYGGPLAGVGKPKGHQDYTYLVLRVHYHDAKLLFLFGKEVEETGRGSHGIRDIDLKTSLYQAKANRFVPRKERQCREIQPVYRVDGSEAVICMPGYLKVQIGTFWDV